MTVNFPPALILILGAILVPVLKGKVKSAYLLLLPLLTFGAVCCVPDGIQAVMPLMDLKLIVLQGDRMSRLFAMIFSVTAFLGLLYILHQKQNLEFCSALFYAGCSLGVVFAGDLITLFFFWEMLTFGAVFLIVSRFTERAKKAALRYLLVHIVGGLILLAGIILHLHEHGGTALVGHIGLNTLASRLIFLGFGINCAWPILHAWIPDTYPEASAGGVVFMSAFTTKAAVYVLARCFAGEDLLILIGSGMTVIPIFYAVIENDIRRVLSYSLINQVGVMVIGVGVGTTMSLNGTNAHVVSHIIYKGLLFMSIGAVLYRTGKTKATDLGGLYKSMPFTCTCCIIGAASISAFPLFSGFVSKSMVMSAVAYDHHPLTWLILLFASAGVMEHAGIKVPFFTFFGHDSGIRCKEAPLNMRLAMGTAAALCILIGIFPNQTLYPLLPFDGPGREYMPYTPAHVITQFQLLCFSALAFVLLVLSGFYPAEMRSINLDGEWLYRKPSRWGYQFFDRVLNGVNTFCADLFVGRLTGTVNHFFRSAPSRILVWLLVPIWKSRGADDASLSRLKADLYEKARVGTFPIGLTAILAVIFLMIFMLIQPG
jgi:multicomponent Na+:H+ antiporter subunit D